MWTNRRLLRAAALTAALASACSSPPAPVPPAPRAAATAPVPSAPRPAPRTSGVPVVVAQRTPTPITGVEWAWLLPDARQVALLAEDAAGHRPIRDPVFIAGPGEAMITVHPTGRFVLQADGATHDLGPWLSGGFDAAGKSVLLWDATSWTLFSRSGEAVTRGAISAGAPLLLPTGLLLTPRTSFTQLQRPPSTILMTATGQCKDVLARATRLVCLEASPYGFGSMMTVHSLETGQVLARISDVEAMAAGSGKAMTADGSMLAFARGEAKVVDIKPGKLGPQARVIGRDLPTYTPRPPRVALTADGSFLCVEASDRTHIYKTAGAGGPMVAPSGRASLCMFTQRGQPPVRAGGYIVEPEWEATVFDVPVHEGFDLVARYPSTGAGNEVIGASADGKTLAYLEQKKVRNDRETQWTLQAVVLDAATHSERRVIAAGEINASVIAPPRLEVSPAGDLIRVCTASLSPECKVYDAATGAATAATFQGSRLASPQMQMGYDTPMPTATLLDVASLLPPVAMKAPTLASWRDEGAYLSVEIDLGDGATQRLNVKDSANRAAREVHLLGAGAGRLLAVSTGSSMVVWSISPLEMHAVIVPVEKGAAALFPDGTYEAIGKDVERAMRCQRGDDLVPVSECGDLRAPSGTLAEVVRQAMR